MTTKNNTLSPVKIVFLIPNFCWFGRRPWDVIPVTIAVLTRLCREENIAIQVVDANIARMTEESCVQTLEKLHPDIVLVSSLSIEYSQPCDRALELAKKACPDCTTVLGGIYPTVMPEEALENNACDFIFVGPAEGRIGTFLRLLITKDFEEIQKLSGVGYKKHDGKPEINTIDHSQYRDIKPVDPDYSLIDVSEYLHAPKHPHYLYTLFKEPTAMLNTSFGCIYNCIFCATRTIRGKNAFYRTADGVLNEIDWFYRIHHVRHFSIADDLFLANKKRAVTILQTIIDRGYNITLKITLSVWHLDDELLELMKKAGCVLILLFVESGSKRVLKEIIRKPLDLEIMPAIAHKCKELDFLTSANYVIGFPGETWDEIRQTFRVAEELDFDYNTFCIATPFPKTDLYELCKKEQLLPADFNFRSPQMMGLGQGFITTDEFTPQELMIVRAYEWDRINFKTSEKKARVARILDLTLEELEDHRKETRRKFGLHHHGVSKKETITKG
jgi:anaerobic magnesium-protoporphyrin IX monomethyl ester cyclase